MCRSTIALVRALAGLGLSRGDVGLLGTFRSRIGVGCCDLRCRLCHILRSGSRIRPGLVTFSGALATECAWLLVGCGPLGRPCSLPSGFSGAGTQLRWRPLACDGRLPVSFCSLVLGRAGGGDLVVGLW